MMVGTDNDVDSHAYPGQIRQDKNVLHTLVGIAPRRLTGALDTRSLRIRATAMIDWLITEANLVDIRLGERVTDAVFRDGFWTARQTRIPIQRKWL